MSKIGDNLRGARARSGLKQTEVAEKLGCAPASLTNWENGKFQPSFDVLSKLCDIYNISPLSLLDRAYDYADIVAITEKPVAARSYDEQVALNFSAPIIGKLVVEAAQHDEVEQAKKKEDFIKNTDLLNRLGGTLTESEIAAVQEDYASYGSADSDILFAFHALTAEHKLAFLSMLCGMLSDVENLQDFNGDMDTAALYTLDALKALRIEIRGA